MSTEGRSSRQAALILKKYNLLINNRTGWPSHVPNGVYQFCLGRKNCSAYNALLLFSYEFISHLLQFELYFHVVYFQPFSSWVLAVVYHSQFSLGNICLQDILFKRVRAIGTFEGNFQGYLEKVLNHYHFPELLLQVLNVIMCTLYTTQPTNSYLAEFIMLK